MQNFSSKLAPALVTLVVNKPQRFFNAFKIFIARRFCHQIVNPRQFKHASRALLLGTRTKALGCPDLLHNSTQFPAKFAWPRHHTQSYRADQNHIPSHFLLSNAREGRVNTHRPIYFKSTQSVTQITRISKS